MKTQQVRMCCLTKSEMVLLKNEMLYKVFVLILLGADHAEVIWKELHIHKTQAQRYLYTLDKANLLIKDARWIKRMELCMGHEKASFDCDRREHLISRPYKFDEGSIASEIYEKRRITRYRIVWPEVARQIIRFRNTVAYNYLGNHAKMLTGRIDTWDLTVFIESWFRKRVQSRDKEGLPPIFETMYQEFLNWLKRNPHNKYHRLFSI